MTSSTALAAITLAAPIVVEPRRRIIDAIDAAATRAPSCEPVGASVARWLGKLVATQGHALALPSSLLEELGRQGIAADVLALFSVVEGAGEPSQDAPSTARAEFLFWQARGAIGRARAASPTSATDWYAAASREAQATLREIEQLEGRVDRASMGEAAAECRAILREAREQVLCVHE